MTPMPTDDGEADALTTTRRACVTGVAAGRETRAPANCGEAPTAGANDETKAVMAGGRQVVRDRDEGRYDEEAFAPAAET